LIWRPKFLLGLFLFGDPVSLFDHPVVLFGDPALLIGDPVFYLATRVCVGDVFGLFGDFFFVW
jgi:hypothetical protein